MLYKCISVLHIIVCVLDDSWFLFNFFIFIFLTYTTISVESFSRTRSVFVAGVVAVVMDRSRIMPRVTQAQEISAYRISKVRIMGKTCNILPDLVRVFMYPSPREHLYV